MQVAKLRRTYYAKDNALDELYKITENDSCLDLNKGN